MTERPEWLAEIQILPVGVAAIPHAFVRPASTTFGAKLELSATRFTCASIGNPCLSRPAAGFTEAVPATGASFVQPEIATSRMQTVMDEIAARAHLTIDFVNIVVLLSLLICSRLKSYKNIRASEIKYSSPTVEKHSTP